MPHNGNFNPLLHQNYSLGMKPQSGHSKGRRRLGPKSSPRLMNLVSVFCRRNSSTHKCFQNLLPHIHKNHESMNPRIPHQTCDPQSPDWKHWDLWGSYYGFTQVNDCGANIYYSALITRLKPNETSLQDSFDCFKAKAGIISNCTNTYQKRQNCKLV